MEKEYVHFCGDPVSLVDFLNENNIKKEDIIYIEKCGDKYNTDFHLVYYGTYDKEQD